MSFQTESLNALSGLSGPLPQTLAVDEPGVRLRANITALDVLACAFDALNVEIDALATADLDRLKEVSDHLAYQLSYLLEAIATIEVDQDSCTVLLRSTPPQKAGGDTTYYELLVKQGGLLSLARYTKVAGDPLRRRVDCAVTREVFGRLCQDMGTADQA